MCDCNDNPVVLEGPRGISGHYILCAYNNSTGVGNTNPIGEDTLYECALAANTLISSGDELELFLYLNYFDNDLVNLNFKLDGSNVYQLPIQDADPATIFIKIKIARISASSQLWTIEEIRDSSTNFIQTIAAYTTTFNLGTSTTFQITADNTAPGAGQLVLKKAVFYKNIIQ
jgi:hypothetical protein